MKKIIQDEETLEPSKTDSPTVMDPVLQWLEILKVRREKVLRTSSRGAIHDLRRSCRIGQSLLDFLPNDPIPVCKKVSSVLAKTLRSSRSLRNADVLQKFLSKEKLDLKYEVSRKKQIKKLHRRLEEFWKSLSGQSVKNCCEMASSELRRRALETGGGPKTQMDLVLGNLKEVYSLWSSGEEKDFAHVHDLRVSLKKISGRDVTLGWHPEFGKPLKKNEKKDLASILKLLGRMSDFLMMENVKARLKGSKKERNRFLKMIRGAKRSTDKKIVKFLIKIPKPSAPVPVDFSSHQGHPSDTPQPKE